MATRSKAQPAVLDAAPGSPAAVLASRSSGLRVRPQRPARAFFAGLVVVAAVVAALALYTRIGDRSEVLVVTRPVLAGDEIRDEDLRVVSISSDDDITTVSADARAGLVGQYARVRMVSGSFVVTESFQREPLVTPGRVLSAVTVPVGLIPVGLREQSRVALVMIPGDELGEVIGEAPRLVEATITAIPRNLTELVGSDAGPRATMSLSVEIAPEDVELVGSAKAASVHVLEANAPFPTSLQDLTGTPAESGATANEAAAARESIPAESVAVEPVTTTGDG